MVKTTWKELIPYWFNFNHKLSIPPASNLVFSPLLMKNFLLYIILLISLFSSQDTFAYCEPLGKVQSDRITNYTMNVTLDHEKKMAFGTSRIVWHNPSNERVNELKMYMYLNSFKNMNSTWLKPTRGEVFGTPLGERKEEEWGFITIDSISVEGGSNLTSGIRYIQEDGNTDDQSVLLVPLTNAVKGQDSLVLNLTFRSKLPKTIARTGYGGNNFHLFVHWYPKLGVFEQNLEGDWDWNCHQFQQGTEFYGDFGVYDFTMTCIDELVVGSSGCLIAEQNNDDGTKTVRYLAEDVIDFAWCVSPELEEYIDQWEDVQIKLLVPRDHCRMADRYMTAIKHSLQYFNDHLGKYPYPGITLMDPPFHSLRNGFMEYPTFATAGTVYGMPRWFRGSESLAIHEFAHQFFMGVLANNEKEEAWLDEGFVTYYEDRIMEDLFSPTTSQIDLFGFKYGNSELSRDEYVGMHDQTNSAIARPGWDINGDFKGIVYSKTASMLKTLERQIGKNNMDDLMRGYFTAFKFKHPRRADFVNTVSDYVTVHFSKDRHDQLITFINQCLDGSDTIDFAISEVSENNASISRTGNLSLPVEIQTVLSNQDTINQIWNANELTRTLSFPENIMSIHIDPESKIYMDRNFNNNSYTIQKNRFTRYFTKTVNWVQHILQSTSFLI